MFLVPSKYIFRVLIFAFPYDLAAFWCVQNFNCENFAILIFASIYSRGHENRDNLHHACENFQLFCIESARARRYVLSLLF